MRCSIWRIFIFMSLMLCYVQYSDMSRMSVCVHVREFVIRQNFFLTFSYALYINILARACSVHVKFDVWIHILSSALTLSFHRLHSFFRHSQLSFGHAVLLTYKIYIYTQTCNRMDGITFRTRSLYDDQATNWNRNLIELFLVAMVEFDLLILNHCMYAS